MRKILTSLTDGRGFDIGEHGTVDGPWFVEVGIAGRTAQCFDHSGFHGCPFVSFQWNGFRGNHSQA